MTDLRAPTVLAELLALWRIAPASDRVAFLAAIVSPVDRAEPVVADAEAPSR